MKEFMAGWTPAGGGAVAGLFAARLALEVTGTPWPTPFVVAGGACAALGGAYIARRASRLTPFIPLLIYVLWPRRDPGLAASMALLAGLFWLCGREVHRVHHAAALADGVTFAAGLALYGATAAPDLLPADAGEFQLVAARLGVAHPPGYPLYTLIGHIFTRLLPWGTPAYRLNLLSALLAAGTLVWIARATRLWAGQLGAPPLTALGGGMAAALTLGSANTFWAQATIANVRTPAVFLAAFALHALARLSAAAPADSEADRALLQLALALGLGGGHYPPLAFVSIFFLVYTLLTDRRLLVQPRRWLCPLGVGALAFLLPLLYLPLRGAAGAILAPPGLDTPAGFLHHFLASGFAGDMFAFANPAIFPHRLALTPTLFAFQFNTPLLAAALGGLLGLLWRERRLFVLLAGSLAIHTYVTITYRAPQTVEYLMPAYLPIAIAVGLLPALLTGARTRTLPSLLLALVVWSGLLNGARFAGSFLELARDRTARQTAGPLLETAPGGALILADWHWAMPLRYLQVVEGRRPDVEVQYVWPVAGQEYADVWRRWVEQAAPGRAVLLTHFYEFDGYTAEPWGAGFLLHPRPAPEAAAALTPAGIVFGERVELIGYRAPAETFQPGQAVEFTLAWRAVEMPPPSFTLRLVDAEGQPVAAADRRLSQAVVPREVRFERLVLPLYPTLPPGRYRITLGAYDVTGSGFETLPTRQGAADATLMEIVLTARVRPPFTLHPQTIPFAGGPTLVGVDYDRSAPDALRVYLHWHGETSAAQVRVWDTHGVEGMARLPVGAAGTYQTVAVDLPGEARGRLRLALSGARPAGVWGAAVGGVWLPAPARDARFLPLGDELAVIGATADAVGGAAATVDVRWVALRPLTRDVYISVRLTDGAGQTLGRHDYQPALGAIPTLKWVRGNRVVDRHLLPLPTDFAGGEVTATLVAYDGFRLAPLPPLDGRFGEAPLGRWMWP